MFPDKLKDEYLLARWNDAVVECNTHYYLGKQFTADQVYESINTACDMTQVRNLN